MRIGAAIVDGMRRTIVVGDGTSTVLAAGAPDADDYVRGTDPAEFAAAAAAAAPDDVVPTDSLRLAAPLVRFNRDVLCTGWNYWDHYEESRGKREGQDPAERPVHPTFFTKGPNSVAAPDADLVIDAALSPSWDYEVELALVIGRQGRSIPAERALEHVAGYLLANDVSQRDLQRAHGGQWLKGKSIDGCLPLGPWLTTADEVEDVTALRLEFELNGQRLQDAGTRQMAFDIPTLIAELSRGMTLTAGDVLLTGTPAGIGNAREPKLFLAPGDVLVSRIPGLGELRNTAVAGSLTEYVTS